jgi:putative transposase
VVHNRKRNYTVYREEGLQVRTKRRKKLSRPRIPMPVPHKANQRWSMDFVSDQLANGRRFRILNIVDDFNRECVLQVVDFFIAGHRLAREPDRLAESRPLPAKIVCGNGQNLLARQCSSGRSKRA